MDAVPIVIARHFITAQSVPGFLCSESIADQAMAVGSMETLKCFCHRLVMRKEKNPGYL